MAYSHNEMLDSNEKNELTCALTWTNVKDKILRNRHQTQQSPTLFESHLDGIKRRQKKSIRVVVSFVNEHQLEEGV